MLKRNKKPGNYFKAEAQPIDQQIGKRIKKLCAPWQCHWRYNGQERWMDVPVDYLYDGGSIPRPAWSIIGITPSGPGDSGFLPHDVLYRAKGGKKPEAYAGAKVYNHNGSNVLVSREEADWVMYEGLRLWGIPKHRARIAWFFVRAFGGVLRHWGGPMPVPE